MEFHYITWNQDLEKSILTKGQVFLYRMRKLDCIVTIGSWWYGVTKTWQCEDGRDNVRMDVTMWEWMWQCKDGHDNVRKDVTMWGWTWQCEDVTMWGWTWQCEESSEGCWIACSRVFRSVVIFDDHRLSILLCMLTYRRGLSPVSGTSVLLALWSPNHTTRFSR